VESADVETFERRACTNTDKETDRVRTEEAELPGYCPTKKAKFEERGPEGQGSWYGRRTRNSHRGARGRDQQPLKDSFQPSGQVAVHGAESLARGRGSHWPASERFPRMQLRRE